MTRYTETFWQVLRAITTGSTTPDDESQLVHHPCFEAAVRRIRRLDPLQYEHADLLFDAGVIRGGCAKAFAQLNDPVLLQLTAQLYGNLLNLMPVWLDMTRPSREIPAPVVRAPAPVAPAPMEEESGVAAFLKQRGFNPAWAAGSLEDMVDKVRSMTGDQTL